MIHPKITERLTKFENLRYVTICYRNVNEFWLKSEMLAKFQRNVNIFANLDRCKGMTLCKLFWMSKNAEKRAYSRYPRRRYSRERAEIKCMMQRRYIYSLFRAQFRLDFDEHQHLIRSYPEVQDLSRLDKFSGSTRGRFEAPWQLWSSNIRSTLASITCWTKRFQNFFTDEIARRYVCLRKLFAN